MTKNELVARMGGFMRGICHPSDDIDTIYDTGIRWIRWDVPYPYDAEGNETAAFSAYRARCERFAAKGIRTVAISPYPRAFLANGIDVHTPDGLKAAEAVCRRMAAALRGSVGCWQVTNEMYIVGFRAPLSEAESVEFLIASMKGVRAGDPDALVGHNNHIPEWKAICDRIEAETGGSDYAGVDLYDGTWSDGGPDTYGPKLAKIAAQSGLPVILMEFGFASRGGNLVPGEVDAFIRSFGYPEPSKVREQPLEFAARVLDQLSPPLAAQLRRSVPADQPGVVDGSFTHLLKKWGSKPGIPHDEAGQAQFYTELLPKLISHPDVAGAVLYCWRDSPKCWNCGQDDCPCETAWGLVRCDDTLKPAREAVKAIFTGMESSGK